jgi:putative effector of murein hydrolase
VGVIEYHILYTGDNVVVVTTARDEVALAVPLYFHRSSIAKPEALSVAIHATGLEHVAVSSVVAARQQEPRDK